MMRRLVNKFRAQGLGSVLRAAASRVIPMRARAWPMLEAEVAGKAGLEIGGPSGYFSRRGRMPVYAVASMLDNCNFAGNTLWEGAISPGRTVAFAGNPRTGADLGAQFIAEATDLSGIEDASYDFVLSSNTLEHVANPLRALHEWLRVLRPEGVLFLVLPHRDGTFDHRRSVTSLAHIEADFHAGVDEGDQTHLEEILRLHDLSRDPEAGTRAQFEARARDNRAQRSLHHHVFDTRSAASLIDHLGLQILAIETTRPYDILVAARKPVPGTRADNSRILQDWDSRGAASSPFRGDRR